MFQTEDRAQRGRVAGKLSPWIVQFIENKDECFLECAAGRLVSPVGGERARLLAASYVPPRGKTYNLSAILPHMRLKAPLPVGVEREKP